MTREEAIEVYHGLINTKIKEAFEFFAPELRESEDERIRKALIDEIKVWDEDYKLFKHFSKEKVIAYLEKQKEPIDPFDTKLFQDGVKEGRRLEREDIMKEQKPVEWSEKYIADVFEKVGLAKIVREQGNDALTNAVQSAMIELSNGEKREWSEEDEKIRRNLMSLLANMRGDRITEETYQKYYPWLKDLHPSWKPSEEHFQGLRRAITKAEKGSDAWNSLTDLYEQLKKL